MEQAELIELEDDVLHTVFDVLVRDFYAGAVDLHGKRSSTKAQQHWALPAVRKPATDAERFDRIWQQIVSLSGSYEINHDRPETRGAPGYPTDSELLAAHPQATIPRPGGAGAASGSPGPPGRGSGSLSPRWDSTRIHQPLPAAAA